MRVEVKFSSKRFLLTLMLCACSVILLQNHDLSRDASFTFRLLCLAAALLFCFGCYLPSVFLRKRGEDILSVLQSRPKWERWLITAFYCGYFRYTAVYFLLPYTDMFTKKYYTEASPCLIALLLLCCCVYAAFKGANVITRFGIFLFVLAMVTNVMLFGGSLSSLQMDADSLVPRGSLGDFLQDAGYFLTPCFTAVLFACLSGYTRNFRLRQPLIALGFTGLKYALVLFFITFAVGEYALRQEYQTFVLSRAAHFGSFSGFESLYMALATMSVFMIIALLLCAMAKAVNRNGSLPVIVLFAASVFAVHFAAASFDSVKEIFNSPALLDLLSVMAAVVIPLFYLIIGRKRYA